MPGKSGEISGIERGWRKCCRHEPSKRGNSHLAAWHNQRHRTAIRRASVNAPTLGDLRLYHDEAVSYAENREG